MNTEYAQSSEVKAGDTLIADSGFTCIKDGTHLIVEADDKGEIRAFDWCAYRDGREEDGIYGWGRTEHEAIADLLEIESWEDENA